MLLIKEIKKFFIALESPATPFYYCVITLISAAALRDFLEIFSNNAKVSFRLIPAESIFYTVAGYSIAVAFLHYFVFWLVLFMSLAVFFNFILKEDILKILKILFNFSLVILITPTIDLLLSKGRGFSIQYSKPKTISDLLPIPGIATPGMTVTICVGLIGAFLYCLFKSNNLVKGLLGLIGSYLVGQALGVLPAIIHAQHPLFILRFMVIVAIFEIVYIFYLSKKDYAVSVFRDFRWLRIAHYWSMFILGILLARPNFILVLKTESASFILTLIAIALAWIVSVVFNNVFDIEIDKISNPNRPLARNNIPIDFYLKIGYFAAFLALGAAFTVNIPTFFMIILGMGSSFLYSAPPVRFKRIPVFSKIFLSLNSLALVMLGFLFAGREILAFPAEISWFFILLVTVAFNFIDLKDYTGDKQVGISTMPVILGLKKSKVICGAAFIITYVGLGLILLDVRLAIYGLIFGIAQYLFINRKNYQEKPVLIIQLLSVILLLFYLNFFWLKSRIFFGGNINFLFMVWCIRIIPGLAWALAYIFIIKRGFQDKAYGLPLIACCANISWEFIFSFIFPQSPAKLGFNITWFLLDAVILWQIFKYGKSAVNSVFLKRFFYTILILTLAISFFTVLFITIRFEDWQGKYSGYSQNCIMSFLFVLMLLNRNNISGQSIYIAFFKMLGSFVAFTPYLVHTFSPFLTSLGVATFILDWIYISLLYSKLRQLNLNPWRRF